MPLNYDRCQRKPSLLAFAGALTAASAVGLGAYAAHGVADPGVRSTLQMASLYAFGHGVALAALAPGTARLAGRAGLYLILLGTLAFSGSLVLDAMAGTGTRLAPSGGIAMILGWLVWALDALRR
ncbi:MAG TPA: DUF423 domain-containing protein [Pseudoxanthomonas sp.]|nr:DUF423 domain-containing protein [Pseudoxanthomonas sp.]